eukprot:UN16810
MFEQILLDWICSPVAGHDTMVRVVRSQSISILRLRHFVGGDYYSCRYFFLRGCFGRHQKSFVYRGRLAPLRDGIHRMTRTWASFSLRRASFNFLV